MKLTLKKLTLINFKGIKNLEINFSDETSISGMNAVGKTTIWDAWNWLLFGKDSENRSEFNIKTLDANNQSIPMLDHEVTGVIDIDGILTTLKCVYRERYVKKEFSGHETQYYCNDVPMKQKEYKEKINSIIREDLFKLLTNPYHFNLILPWLDRRKILFEMSGEISDADIIGTKKEFHYLAEVLAQKTFVQYKKEIQAKKKKAEDDLKLIPIRIDEKTRDIPNEEPDWKAAETEIARLQKEIDKLDEQIADKTKISAGEFEAVQQKQRAISKIKLDIQKMEFEITSAVNKENQELLSKRNSLNAEFKNLEGELFRVEGQMRTDSEFVRVNNITLIELREKYQTEDAKQLTFNANEFVCPTCLREYPDTDIEQKKSEMIHNFNTNKVKVLEQINSTGQTLKKQIADRENLVKNAEAGIKLLKEKIEVIKATPYPELKTANLDTPEIQKLKNEIKAIEEQPAPAPADTSELKKRKEALISFQDGCKSQLSLRKTIEDAKLRIIELKKEENTLAQVISDLEKEESTLADFTKTKIGLVEESVNSKFEFVKFKMYNQNINGSEEETCECLVNGVPYSDLNSAMKINAGLDCINTLSKHFDVYAPIFVDQAECIINIAETNCQMIKLIVEDLVTCDDCKDKTPFIRPNDGRCPHEIEARDEKTGILIMKKCNSKKLTDYKQMVIKNN